MMSEAMKEAWRSSLVGVRWVVETETGAHVQDNGGPAFPAPMIPCDNQGGYTEVRHTGMPLRDYFAAKAMQAMIGNLCESYQHQPKARPGGMIVTTTMVMPKDSLCTEERPDEDNNVGVMDDAVAISAYRIADAMLKARRK